LQAFKYIGAGLATISLTGAGTGIGIVFGALLAAYSPKPIFEKALITLCIIRFALTGSLLVYLGLMVYFSNFILVNFY